MKKLFFFANSFGSILFFSIFILTICTPDSIEKSSKSFIKKQIREEVQKAIIKEKVSTALQLFIKKENSFLESIISDVVEQKVNFKNINSKPNSTKQTSLKFFSIFLIGEKKIDYWIEDKYDEISSNLKKNIRVFAGINFILFAFITTLLFYQSDNYKEIQLPSFLLFISTVISILLYLFIQDWAYTLVYNNYLGCWYLAYISVIFLFLLDITFNQGELTMKVLEIILDIAKKFVSKI